MLAALLLLAIGPLSAAPSPQVPGEPREEVAASLVDGVVAAVDEDPILASDLERVIALGLVEPRPGESPEELRRRALESLIEQLLRFHEIERFGFGQVPVEEVEARFREIRERFPSPEAFQRRLQALGMAEQDLRQLVTRQLLVLDFIEERLGLRVFVSLDDIRRYHAEVLVPELAARGEQAPPLEEVREQIRALLREQRLNEEIVRWTAELRREADVVVHPEPRSMLPPVVLEIKSEEGAE
jgi:hypothetical protein